jgi:hypothetical protein
MKLIKNLFVSFQLKKALNKKEKYEVIFPVKPKCVGILAADEKEFKETKEYLRSLWGYQVRIIGWYYNERSNEIESFSHKNFSFFGLPTDVFNELMDEKLDFILVPSLSLNPYLRYLLLNNQSKFKMGFLSDENKSYLDFMIKMEGENLKINLKRLLGYFDKIKEAC